MSKFTTFMEDAGPAQPQEPAIERELPREQPKRGRPRKITLNKVKTVPNVKQKTAYLSEQTIAEMEAGRRAISKYAPAR